MPPPEEGSLLVTGFGGFIGSALAARAQSLGLSVTGLSLSGRKTPAADGVTVLEADLSRPDSLHSALADHRFDYIVNLAGYIDHSGFFTGGREVIDQHFTGLLNLLECTRHPGLRGFVQVGSSDEYGSAPAPQRESAREQPISPYSLAKTAASHLLEMLWRTDRFPGRVARLFLVYGPGQANNRFIPQLVQGALNGARFPVSAGGQLRDLCYIDDIVDGLLSLANCPDANGQCLNLASGKPIAIREVIEKVISTVGTGEPEWGKLAYRTGENMALYADTSRARTLLGWSPQVSLDDGIARTVGWYRGHTTA